MRKCKRRNRIEIMFGRRVEKCHDCCHSVFLSGIALATVVAYWFGRLPLRRDAPFTELPTTP